MTTFTAPREKPPGAMVTPRREPKAARSAIPAGTAAAAMIGVLTLPVAPSGGSAARVSQALDISPASAPNRATLLAMAYIRYFLSLFSAFASRESARGGHSEFELSLELHLLREEVLRQSEPAEERGEFDALFVGTNLRRTREQIDDGGQTAVLRQQIHARGPQSPLAIERQERRSLQIAGQGFLVDIEPGDIVDSDGIHGAIPLRRIVFMRFQLRGSDRRGALPPDLDYRRSRGLGAPS